jgi:hypothetical protein
VLVLSPTPTHPIDFGNRRRIYHVCKTIRDLGGQVTFVHYPAESDWRHEIPPASQSGMCEEWDRYFVCPISRDLHPPPAGQYHAMDEWWDPTIGAMLRWLFSVDRFDVFIVNYTWLSRALELAPEGVLRVLDTHDRFSARKELFEANGIRPEFFYMTPEEERRALERADVVWAIKREEEAYFRSVGIKRVLTMAHAEPFVPRRPIRRGPVVRFGIAGARNSVNARNFARFLGEAVRFLHRTLLPCEIVVAGTCCELLDNPGIPCIRFLGRLESMDSFYDEVDVVLGAMDFSTGLKIKIGEALSYGKAIVSHAHCFEGYVATHPYHSLGSFAQILAACEAIVRDPRVIAELEDASMRSMREAQGMVAAAMEETLDGKSSSEQALVIVLPARAAAGYSIARDHALEAAEYFRHQCRIRFFLEGAAVRLEAGALAKLRSLGPVTCDPALRALVESCADKRSVAGIEFATWEELADSGHLGFWFAGIPSRLEKRQGKRIPWSGANAGVLSIGASDRSVREFGKWLQEASKAVVVADVEPSALFAAMRPQDHGIIVPCLVRGHLSESLRVLQSCERKSVALLAPALGDRRLETAVEICLTSFAGHVDVVYARPEDRHLIPEMKKKAGWGAVQFAALPEYLDLLARRGKGPYLAATIGDSSSTACFVELLNRSCIPTLRLYCASHCAEFDGGAPRVREGGALASAATLSEYLCDAEMLESLKRFRMERYGYRMDAGWTRLWPVVGELARAGLKHGAADAARREAPRDGR